MPAALSKLTPITSTCVQYVHPWTESCSIATAGLILQAAQDSLRIYSAVYTLSLLMRLRWPSLKDVKRTIIGILQSTAFLTTSAFSYCLYLCIIRKVWGSFNYFTVSYVPAFMSSVTAILIERPSRRGLLCLYVSNVATEAIWQMAVSRGLVKSIPGGQGIIFGLSAAILLAYFRQDLHHKHSDSIFDIFRFVVGKSEEKPKTIAASPAEGGAAADPAPPSQYNRNRLPLILKMIRLYQLWLNKQLAKIKIPVKHKTCPHPQNSCLHYSLSGGIQLFSIGLGVQITLKLLLQMTRIFRNGPGYLRKVLFNRDTLKLGVFLGGFSALFRFCSCFFRHVTGKDHPLYAVPSTLIASIAFYSYPDTTVALYVMWKMLQISYNIGVDKGFLPNVPHFTMILYCFSTAMLFHTATLEPLNLRRSYWKFLHSLSGGRVAGMDRLALDIYGFDTSKQLAEVLTVTKTAQQIKFTL